MPRIVATAEVEDYAKWEAGFRTHGDLFKSQTVSVTHFAQTGENAVMVCFDVDDVDAFHQVLESPATAEAMAFDGIRRETVNFTTLDGQYAP